MLQTARKIHLYFGVLISPALLFFAFTGALQTLDLHEAAGNSYKAPLFLATLGQIHKKQTWQLSKRRPPAPGAFPSSAGGTSQANSASAPGKNGLSARPPELSGRSSGAARSATLGGKIRQHLPLKIFFLIVSLGLFTSTVTGIYMAYMYGRSKLLVTALLILGALLPIVLLPF